MHAPLKRIRRRASAILFGAIVVSIVGGGPGMAPAEEAAPALQIALKPLPGSDSHTIEAIDVTETLAGRIFETGSVLLELAYVTFNVPSAAGRIEQLEAHDEHGRVSVSARDLGEGDSARRQWFADRETGETLTVRYRVAVAAPLAPRGAAPPTELRNEHGAVSGSGAAFLLRPPAGSYRFSVTWDLSSLPDGASAVSSLGYQPNEALPVDTLDRVYFMAGNLGRYPDESLPAEFFSAWQGDPPFEAGHLMASAETLREAFIIFFDAERGGYGIMMRPNPVNPGGGIGLHRSFVITFDQETDVEDLGLTLSHEMFHTFQPQMDDGGEPNRSLEHAWFNEGLAVFYQREFLFRAGLIGAGAYLRDLNTHAARYYTNALGDTPNSEVAAGFWRDTRIRTLPYDRGFLYFATVDEAMRKSSGNRGSLDDLAKEMRTLQDRGQAPTPASWAALVKRELGDDGVSALDQMLAGSAPLPSSDAFGPCFQRISRDLQRYELGFEPAVLVETERIVRGLVQGSAAELAGLRNGDRILKPVPQDAIQGNQEARLTLQVRRDGQDSTINYRPRGETVSAWQWERIPTVPEETCRASRAAPVHLPHVTAPEEGAE